MSKGDESSKELYLKVVVREKEDWKKTRDELRKQSNFFESSYGKVPVKESAETLGRHEELARLAHSIKLTASEAQSAMDRVTALVEQYNLVRSNCDLIRENCSRLIGLYQGVIGAKNPLLKHRFVRQLQRDLCGESEAPILTDEHQM